MSVVTCVKCGYPACDRDHEVCPTAGLRDQFAMAALPLVVNRDFLSSPGYALRAALSAYEVADAMLEARKQK